MAPLLGPASGRGVETAQTCFTHSYFVYATDGQGVRKPGPILTLSYLHEAVRHVKDHKLGATMAETYCRQPLLQCNRFSTQAAAERGLTGVASRQPIGEGMR
jgi:hypothetical protein